MNGEEFCPHEWSKLNIGEGSFPFINRAAPELPMETGKLSCMVLRKMYFLASGETTTKLILFAFLSPLWKCQWRDISDVYPSDVDLLQGFISCG